MKHHWGDQIREYQVGRTCRKHGEDETCIQNCIGTPEKKRPLYRRRHTPSRLLTLV
jgi:hypothetical protein